MASRALVVPLRSSRYVCDSCLRSARSLRSCRIAAARTTHAYSVASSSHPESATRPTEQAHHLGSNSQSKATEGKSTRIVESVEAGIAPLPHRRLISLSGPDAAKFLQGLITNKVDSTRLSPFYSAFLDARGRVLWDVFVWVWPELVAEQGHWSCYIEVDAAEVESLKKHLKKHKLRSKLAINEIPPEGSGGIRVWAAWGGAHEQVQKWSEIAGMEDPRAPGMFRYLANAHRDTLSESLPPVDAVYYHVQRYLHGVPEGQNDIARETALPMEANIDLNGGIDFKKGCYVGQELTIRTKHTGVVRKRVLPVRLYPSDEHIENKPHVTEQEQITSTFDMSFLPCPKAGEDIKAIDDTGAMKKGRAVGKIIAAIGNVGLASCRLENMTPMRISAEGGTYKPGMQFGVSIDKQVVRVEPVLHDWFVRRKEVLWDKEERRKVRTVKEQDSAEID